MELLQKGTSENQGTLHQPGRLKRSSKGKPETLVTKFDEPADVIVFDGFKDMQEEELKKLYDSLGLAMTFT